MKSLALIAHDGKKDEMVQFAVRFQRALAGWNLVGTGTTARLVIAKTGLNVTGLKSGPLGGDVQIANLVLSGQVDAVFFFVEQMDVHPHDPDIHTLQRICNITDTPIATNPATGALVMRGLELANGHS
jgi:methylglyoxal synthase